MGFLERKRKWKKGKIDEREERETFFILFDGVVYIILMSCI